MKAQGQYPGAHLCAQIVYICSSLGKQSQKLDGTAAFLQPQYQAGEAWVTYFHGGLTLCNLASLELRSSYLCLLSPELLLRWGDSALC